MSTAITDIGNAIVSIITANVPKTYEVNNYVKTNPGGYPSINVEYYDGSGEFADTQRNRREYIFRITVMQERVKVGASEAERITRALVDQMITVFDSRTNLQLSNTCDFAYPMPRKAGYINAPDIDVRTAEILLTAILLS